MSSDEHAYSLAIEAVRQQPNSPEAHNQLGIVLIRLGRLEQAITALQRAIALCAAYPDALNNLATALLKSGRTEESLPILHQAILARPQFPEAMFNFGNALYSLHRYQDAATAFKRVIGMLPDSAEAWGNYSSALLAMDAIEQSILAAQKVVELKPAEALAYYNLGNSLKRANRLDEAEHAYRKCIAIDRAFGLAYGNLAICVADQGRIEEAIGLYRSAMALTDESWVAESFIHMLYFHPGETRDSILKEHRKWNEKYVKPVTARPVFANSRDADRRLRVGYVSADFRNHVVGFNILPLLNNHDHTQFEVFCYSNNQHDDDLTPMFRGLVDHWREIRTLSDGQAGQLIQQDRIDILIDLSLHTWGNRLTVFAQRPAPLQVTFAGYPGTTGLAEMDYRISDPYLDPPGSDSYSSEKTVRLPCSFWCYDSMGIEPPINQLSALSRGHLTFGCLNNFLKVNEYTLNVWSQVMHALPNSRLMLLTEPGKTRARVLEQLAALGIDQVRVEFVDRMPRGEYLKCFNRFDISLDTFPYNGHTTTLDSLWMGVPPLTAPGNTTVSRAGLSMLSNLGLAGFAAKNVESLPQRAIEIASDLPRMAAMRSSLREHMRRSPLMDGPHFARDIESAYRQIWHAWRDEG